MSTDGYIVERARKTTMLSLGDTSGLGALLSLPFRG